MAYKPGENFLNTLGTLSTIRSRERAQAFSEAMGTTQEKRAWEQLRMQGGMFEATERRLESNAILRAMLGVYGVEKQDEWERLKASQRAEIMDMLPWLQYGANLNASINDASVKGLMEEGGSPRAAAEIEALQSDLNNAPPDAILPNGMSAADYTLAKLNRLVQMPQSRSGKTNIPVLTKKTPLGITTDYVFEGKDVGSFTNIGAVTPEGQKILDRVIRGKFEAGIGTRGQSWFGAEKGGYPNSIPIDADGGVSSIKLLQESLQYILAELPSDIYQGNVVQDASLTAEAWLGAKNDKNIETSQRVQQALASAGIQINDNFVLTPSQVAAVKHLADYRDAQYGLYTRMPIQDRANKYGLVGYLNSQTESKQNLYDVLEQKQEEAFQKQNVSRLKPPMPGKLPRSDSAAYEDTRNEVISNMKTGIERIFSTTADRAVRGNKEDDGMISELTKMFADIHLLVMKDNKDQAHSEAVDLLNYISENTEVEDDMAIYAGSIAPSEAWNAFQLLITPEEQGGFGLTFSESERKLWRFLGKP